MYFFFVGKHNFFNFPVGDFFFTGQCFLFSTLRIKKSSTILIIFKCIRVLILIYNIPIYVYYNDAAGVVLQCKTSTTGQDTPCMHT